MPARSRSRSYSRGRAAKRYRSRSSSRGSGMYAAAVSPARARSRAPGTRPRISGAHKFSRYCASVNNLGINGTFLATNYKYSFNQLVQSSDFTSLFDAYRIHKVIMTFQLINNPNSTYYTNSNTVINPSNWYPKLWYIVDKDGGPTETVATIKERQGVKCRILQPNKTVKVAFTPACRVLTYSTSTSTGYSPKNIKIDMTDVAVEHYGLNTVIDANQIDPNDTYPFLLNVETKFIFSCYGVR